MTTQVIIDGSNQWYRAYAVGSAHMGEGPGGPVSIMTYMLRRECREYGSNNVIVCWDAGDGGRKTLDPTYKANRSPIPGVWENIVYMKAMVDALGIRNAHKKGYEADDVCGSLAARASKTEDDKAYILSFDKDFYQLVNDSVCILRPGRTVHGKKIPRKVIDRGVVIEEFGCAPEKLTLFKAFDGDKSDNIPRLPVRFMPKFKESLFKVLSLSNNLNDFYNHLDIFDDKYHAELLKFRDRAELNKKLVDIQIHIDVSVEKPPLDGQQFENLCKEMEISRLKFDDWINMPKEPAPPPPTQNSLF
jgi:DNA polymerase I